MFLLSFFFLATPHTFGQSGTNVLPKLLPPYGPMPPTFWEQHGTNIIIAGIALALLAGSVLWRIYRTKPPLIVSPDIEAIAALVKWQGQPEDSNCLSDTSQILRRYVVRAFGFPAGEYTTAEFCRELGGNKKIAPELMPAISDFLRECDRRKFAPAGSPAPFEAVRRALELISIMEIVRNRHNDNERPAK